MQIVPPPQPHSPVDDPNPDLVPGPLPGPVLPHDSTRPIITVGSFSRPFRVANKIVRCVQDEGLWPRVLVCGHASINQAMKGLAGARRTLLQQEEPIDLGVLPRFRSDDHFRPLLAFDTVKLPLPVGVAEGSAAAQLQQQQQGEDGEQHQTQQQQQQQQHAAQHTRQQPGPRQQPQHDPRAASTSQQQTQPQQQQQHSQQHSSTSSSSSGADVVGTQSSPTSPLVIRVAAVGRHARAGGAAAARIREGANVHLTAVGVGAVGTAAMAATHAAFYLWETDVHALVVRPEVVRVVEEGQELYVVKLMLSTGQ